MNTVTPLILHIPGCFTVDCYDVHFVLLKNINAWFFFYIFCYNLKFITCIISF